jgi:ribosomal protein S18 acetylase RimI-like enzyme
MTLQITLATPDQAALVHQIMQDAFAEYIGVLQPPSGTHAETVEDVRRAMSAGGAILAWEDDTAIGSARYNRKPDHFYIGRVAVLPAYRGKGIASAMMAYLEGMARDAGVERVQIGVRMALPQNLALYQWLGYEIISIAPHEKAPQTMVATLAKHL